MGWAVNTNSNTADRGIILGQDGAEGGQQAPLGLGNPQLGVLGGDTQVAHLGDGPAARQSEAVDRRDQRLPGLGPHIGPVGAHALSGPGLNTSGIVFGPFLQVPARAESPAGPGDDGHESVRLTVELRNCISQLAPELPVDGIQRVGAIEGDGYDVALFFVKDCFSQG